MEIDDNHFLALFHYKNEHIDNSFAFGYKDRGLFFIKQSKEEIYTSWNAETSQGKEITQLVDKFLGKKSVVENTKTLNWSLENYFQEEEKKASGKPLQKKKEKFLQRKLHNITHDLEDVEKWKLIEEDLLSEESVDLADHQSVLHGHKIKFSSHMNQWQKRDVVFGKVKKLKKAEEILKARLQETDEELFRVKQGDFEFEVTKEKAIAPLWQMGTSQKNKEDSDHNVKRFRLHSLTGMIALDAQSNDWLRSQGAKEHYWFHIENYTGAHCLVKTDDLSKLSVEDLSAIASMLRDYSKLEINEIPMMYSQLQHVKGLKGVQGKVIIKKPKYLRCNYVNWTERIAIEDA